METLETDAIAIIAMEGRFPGANDVDAFWNNIKNGKECITHFNDDELREAGVAEELIKDPKYVKAKGIVDGVELFDANFFDYSPREAAITDPQHRLFLETCWTALEKAGYCVDKDSSLIGVFAGMEKSTYLYNNLMQNKQYSGDVYQTMIATGETFLTTKVSYKLNLTGPSFNISTACSTSLVAIATACKQLLNYECDMALAGGVTIVVPQIEGYIYREGGILSPDGRCRAFDAKANGTAQGEGVGVVVLKRLDDAIAARDNIEAVIIGAAINNDGADKVGYTAPSVMGQARCIVEAIASAEAKPGTISYIETHGTGTNLGDPIEIEALTKVFESQTDAKQFCAIGSVKTNIGHTDCAAGVAGLIKAVCALKHKTLPPSLNFEKPNPNIDFENSPFYVNTKSQPWKTKGGPRRAGVSAFGIGGTNAHLVLEEAPARTKSSASRSTQMLMLSAKTDTALEKATENLHEFLQQNTKLNTADIAYTLHMGRKDFDFRRAIIYHDDQELVLTHSNKNSAQKRLVFMFQGQGGQYLNMGLDLYKTEAVFKESIDKCCDILLQKYTLDFRDILFATNAKKGEEYLQQTRFVQPMLFMLEYALVQLFMSWGIEPQAVMGHSSGEYVAAVIAGVFKLEDALILIAERGKLFEKLEPGSMLIVPLPEDEILSFIKDENISIAAVNSPTLCVVSGEKEVIAEFRKKIRSFYFGQKVFTKYFKNPYAFHSHMTEPILDKFAALIEKMPVYPAQLPFISTVTGKQVDAEELQDPQYWVKHMRDTVRFSSAVNALLQQKYNIFLELGPSGALTTLVNLHDKQEDTLTLATLTKDKQLTYDALARLWLYGLNINWRKFYAAEKRHRVPLPTYPFERQRYWVDCDAIESKRHQVKKAKQIEKVETADCANPAGFGSITEGLQNIFAQILGIQNVDINADFFELGGHSLLALQLIAKIDSLLKTNVSLSTIYQAKTVNALAKLISKSKGIAMPESIIIPMKPTGNKLPLFLIHPIGGTVFCYMPLIKYLKEQRPCYAIQDPRIDNNDLNFATLEEMATLYIKKIKTIQPEGPYLLGGHSFGGTLAFEMARQLQQQGERIDFIALFDSWAVFADLIQDQQVLQKIVAGQKNMRAKQLSDEVPISKELWKQLYFDRVNLLYNYNPAKTELQPTLFKAETIMSGGENFQHDTNYWDKHTSLTINSHMIPGDHESMLQEPNVQILAQKLNEYLAKLD